MSSNSASNIYPAGPKGQHIHTWPFGPGIYLEQGGKGGGEKGGGVLTP